MGVAAWLDIKWKIVVPLRELLHFSRLPFLFGCCLTTHNH